MTSSSSSAPPSPAWPPLAQMPEIYQHGQPPTSKTQHDATRGPSKAPQTSAGASTAPALDAPPSPAWPPLDQPDGVYEHGQPRSSR